MIEWQNNPPEKPMNWHKAMEYAESLGKGWRLPTIAELIDRYGNKEEDFRHNYYWSLSKFAQSTAPIWLFNFYYGGVDGTDNPIYKYVCCVREKKENKK